MHLSIQALDFSVNSDFWVLLLGGICGVLIIAIKTQRRR